MSNNRSFFYALTEQEKNRLFDTIQAKEEIGVGPIEFLK